ncbi:DUF5667 domain-containing protein [Nostocoides sp. HKS02]|uniref:DUF5667 domain-containing protein n=1 Tax=Nostocoides sp. HKS02 TaxID=1813880 RepID=UPI0012B4AFAF|nr:DUF5667 domain-containing protein [Tetrasphaera sp. HKS02]QGN58337.1 hypothetical protein GKE56_11080 [Tetrasphaera sp. HKS02]
MPVLNRRADAFQRALEGQPTSDTQLSSLLTTADQLRTARPGPSPDPAFVAALRTRLMTEAASLPTPSPAAARSRAERRASARPTPVVVVVGHGLPRALAGAVASALLVGAVVGVASRGSVPGDSLYPVKSWLDNVAVRLADSDFDRGQTYLTQAQEHISDARSVVERPGGSPSADDVNVAVQQAIDSVQGGQRALDRSYAATGNPQALLAMRDFTARALPQVEVLRAEAPAGSLPLVGRLEALLQDSQQAAQRRLAACGAPCATLVPSAYNPASLPGPASTNPAGTNPSAQSGSGSLGSPGAVGADGTTITVPSTAITGGAGGGAPLPHVSAPAGGVVSAGGGGASLGTGGVGVQVPSVTATVPLVSSTLKLPAPSVSLGTGGIRVTLPSSTLLSTTLPGTTITLP